MQDENMGAGIINPFPGQATEWVDYSQGSGDSDDPNHSDVRGFTQDPHLATAVTSRVRDDQVVFNPFAKEGFVHKVVIDLDHDAKLVPSSTPGHHHLFIDKPMSWDNYVRLLCVLAEVGLVEPGYVSASIDRGHTSVRLPHVKRDTPRSELAEALERSDAALERLRRLEHEGVHEETTRQAQRLLNDVMRPSDLDDPTGMTPAPWYQQLT